MRGELVDTWLLGGETSSGRFVLGQLLGGAVLLPGSSLSHCPGPFAPLQSSPTYCEILCGCPAR